MTIAALRPIWRPGRSSRRRSRPVREAGRDAARFRDLGLGRRHVRAIPAALAWRSASRRDAGDASKSSIEAAAAAGFPQDGCIEEEVRRNWATFRYFASHDLTTRPEVYFRASEEDAVGPQADSRPGEGRLDEGSAILLAGCGWTRTTSGDSITRRPSRTAKSTPNITLVGLHLNSKRWKNWIWATFEHRLNPGRCDEISYHDTFSGRDAPRSGRKPSKPAGRRRCPRKSWVGICWRMSD